MYLRVYFMEKTKALTKFKEFREETEYKVGRKVWCMYTDNGR